MEYYKKAANAIREGEESAVRTASQIGLTAAGAGLTAAGGRLASSLVPSIGAFINKYVPENIAKAGLSKLDPRLGKFMEGAMKEGYGFDEVKEFLGEKIEKTQEDEKKSELKKYSPVLHTFVSQLMKSGQFSPEEAAAKAKQKLGASEAKIIEKLEKDYKMDLASIIESLYGGGQKAAPQGQQAQQQAPIQGQQQVQQPQQMQPQVNAPPQQQQAQQGGKETILKAIQLAAQSRQKRQPQ